MTTQQTLQTKEYVQTELGELPEEWIIKKIKDIATTQAGGTPSTFKPEYWNGDIPWINSGELKNSKISKPSKYITKAGLENSATKLFPKNTTVIALTGATTGMVGILDFDCSTNQSVVGILPNNKFEEPFLFFYLMYSRNKVLQFASGAAQPHINKAVVDNIIVPVPPISEQENISFVLSTVQNAQQSSERTINSLQELKKSLMKHLFTYGAVSFEDASKVKLKETEIGQIPAEWEVMKLQEIITKKNQGINTTVEKIKYNSDGEYKVIRAQNILEGKLNYLDVVYVSKDTYNTVNDNFKPKQGDILYGNIGSQLGLSAIVESDEEFMIAWNVMRIQADKKKVNERFLMYSLIKNRNRLRELSTKSTMPFISGAVFSKIEFSIPKAEEQKKIVSFLLSVDEHIHSEEKRLASLNKLFNSLLKNLMTGKVRVKELEI